MGNHGPHAREGTAIEASGLYVVLARGQAIQQVLVALQRVPKSSLKHRVMSLCVDKVPNSSSDFFHNGDAICVRDRFKLCDLLFGHAYGQLAVGLRHGTYIVASSLDVKMLDFMKSEAAR